MLCLRNLVPCDSTRYREVVLDTSVALSGAPVSKGTGETVAGGRAAGELARLVLPLFHRGFTL